MKNKKKKNAKINSFYVKKREDLKNSINTFSKKVPLYDLFLNENNKLKLIESIKTDSWYDSKIYNRNTIDDNKYTFIESDIEKPKHIYKCEKIILLPTIEQKKILLNMLEGYRLIYNSTLKFIKTREYKNKVNKTIKVLSEEEKEINNYKKEIRNNKKKMSEKEKICSDIVDDIIGNVFKKEIRDFKVKTLQKNDNNDIILDDKIIKTYFLKEEIHNVSKKFKTPVHTLNYAVQLACASYKSCLTNLKNGNIKNFNVRYLKSNKNSLIMDIEKTAFKSKGFFTSILGKEINNTLNKEYNVLHDCKLHYNRNKDRLTLLIPKEIEPEYSIKQNEYISIDLGVRTLMNCKTNKEYIKIGSNMQTKLKKYIKREEKYNLIKDFKKKDKLLKKIREKISNNVNDLQWKTINYLTTNYKNIIIGKWSTKSIISKKDSSLQKMTKKIIQRMSYYKLLERLKYKSIIHNNNLIIKEEWYTSKMCTSCGNLKEDLGGASEYNCSKCNLITDRDYNGCRNIFLSCITKIN